MNAQSARGAELVVEAGETAIREWVKKKGWPWIGQQFIRSFITAALVLAVAKQVPEVVGAVLFYTAVALVSVDALLMKIDAPGREARWRKQEIDRCVDRGLPSDWVWTVRGAHQAANKRAGVLEGVIYIVLHASVLVALFVPKSEALGGLMTYVIVIFIRDLVLRLGPFSVMTAEAREAALADAQDAELKSMETVPTARWMVEKGLISEADAGLDDEESSAEKVAPEST